MKKAIILSTLILSSIVAVNAQDWKTDIDTAKAVAKIENKKIILVFQGSDWCAPCIKLDREIWSSKEFQDYAKDNYVLVKADFPRKKANKLPKEQQKINNQLAEKYNQEGFFPLVVVLDSNGDKLGYTDYKKVSPSEYIQLLNSF